MSALDKFEGVVRSSGTWLKFEGAVRKMIFYRASVRQPAAEEGPRETKRGRVMKKEGASSQEPVARIAAHDFLPKQDALGRISDPCQICGRSAVAAVHPPYMTLLPRFVFCRDCGERVEWFFSDDEIVCAKAHHIVATFSERPS